jgi:hypothetical protein
LSSSSGAEYSEGVGLVVGLVALLIVLGATFHYALSLHGPPPTPHTTPVVVLLSPAAMEHR